jgi:hypothetical protein
MNHRRAAVTHRITRISSIVVRRAIESDYFDSILRAHVGEIPYIERRQMRL